MALVTCPECGKANVSDIAEHCPECGYPIKKHYDEIKQKELEQIRHENRVQSVPMPEKPKVSGFFIFFGCLLSFILILEIYFAINPPEPYSSHDPSPIAVIIFAILFLGGGAFTLFYAACDNYKKDLENYNSALEDFNKYQEQVAREEERIEYINSKKPKCPHCGSINIEKISAMSRSISVSALGLASDKIGKQYHCKDCDHNW